MIGPPGAGKTMLAQRLATLLPPLSLVESLETTRIYSSMGLLDRGKCLMAKRPMRMPHHSSSGPALIGGGPNARPGELSLAHHGILFLDEFAEFPRHVLEMIRQPLEDGVVTVSRAKRTMTYPAQFICVASLNPCPCGYHGAGTKRCRCTPPQIERYMSKVSGPLMDRIDIHIDVPAMTFDKLYAKTQGAVSSAEIRAHVLKARKIQKERFGSHWAVNNATMSHREVERFCALDTAGQGLLKHAMSEFGLSARAHDKICKVARTIADLEPSETIKSEHIAEAIGYRRLDRKL
jgi:magnesium chelatase family protein